MASSESDEYKGTLERELGVTDKVDLTVPYSEVAKAFPSEDPHPRTFEHSIIAEKELRTWADARGWEVSMAPEALPEGSKSLPPVRFRFRKVK
ncbi:hypothetical protein [Salinisphaera hydrothermalis]|uniref:hypothetical protein n=1 Tax=Salinisphaera hydrothermalis TaxID=563188 RepID=UPI0012ECA179|nr:hypothetical protein [Salinisphaera hydrothermalis]